MVSFALQNLSFFIFFLLQSVSSDTFTCRSSGEGRYAGRLTVVTVSSSLKSIAFRLVFDGTNNSIFCSSSFSEGDGDQHSSSISICFRRCSRENSGVGELGDAKEVAVELIKTVIGWITGCKSGFKGSERATLLVTGGFPRKSTRKAA